jgi:AcrR family transcriptional regulator
MMANIFEYPTIVRSDRRLPHIRRYSIDMGYSPEHSEATRRRVIDAAGHLFRKLGYDGASIDEIMSRAGLTRGAFYQHFKSKADLFAAAVGQDL